MISKYTFESRPPQIVGSCPDSWHSSSDKKIYVGSFSYKVYC